MKYQVLGWVLVRYSSVRLFCISQSGRWSNRLQTVNNLPGFTAHERWHWVEMHPTWFQDPGNSARLWCHLHIAGRGVDLVVGLSQSLQTTLSSWLRCSFILQFSKSEEKNISRLEENCMFISEERLNKFGNILFLGWLKGISWRDF